MKVSSTPAAIPLLLITEFTAHLVKLSRDLGVMLHGPTPAKIVLP